MRIAIDTGGTFTDCVYAKGDALAVLKVLSTPDDPARAVLGAIQRILESEAVDAVASGKTRRRSGTEDLQIRHGTTIGTNALLERKGARVAFVTTAGFEDTIAIGRQARHELYNWMASPRPCLVPAELRFGIKERVSAGGEVLISPSERDLAELSEKIRASGAESIAISLLFSFVNPDNEKQLVAALTGKPQNLGADGEVRAGALACPVERSSTILSRGPLGATGERACCQPPGTGSLRPISVSHQLLPEFREYERAATVVVNAYLAPKASGYVLRLQSSIEQQHKGALYVMQSSGGIVSAKIASEEPVRTVLSGPAGGVIGAHRIARIAGFNNIIAFDMGGTSTDVSLIAASGPKITNEAQISEIPVSVPMLDIHTVGAGGGSLARFDRGGILHVGPMSAGADPGPICYGRGEQPTVTDANLILGRLDPELSLAGTVRLDLSRTRNFMEKGRGTIKSIEQFAIGIVRLAEAEMEKAIRLISVERGHNPREFVLVCFGGAGPLHACSLARALEIPRVLVPAMPGGLSAFGILMSDVVRDYSRTVMARVEQLQPAFNRQRREGHAQLPEASRNDAQHRQVNPELTHRLELNFRALEEKAFAEFRNQGLRGVSTRSADLRYAGQGYEINVPAGPQMLASFHAAHQKRYGHGDATKPVEVVNLRVRMVAAAEKIELPSEAKAGVDYSGAVLKKKPVLFGGEWLETPVLDRERLLPGNQFGGPAIVHEYSATTVLPPGFKAQVDEFSNLVIELRHNTP
jgi:N-methylhydantoinase A